MENLKDILIRTHYHQSISEKQMCYHASFPAISSMLHSISTKELSLQSVSQPVSQDSTSVNQLIGG